jgi:Reverse transcriptase (RNA-dependent DNA polymerase)
LERALYGLKQAPHLWGLLLRQTLLDLGYKPTSGDPCIFYKYVDGHKHPIIINTYVDDLIILFPKELSQVWLNDKQLIMKQFQIDDIGEVKFCLKMLITRDRLNRTITVDQIAYIEAMLHQFDIDPSTVTGTDNPGLSDTALSNPAAGTGHPLNAEKHHLYRQIVGKTSYLANTTRSDISFHVNQLARYVNAPTTLHMKHARHLLRYLITTKNYKLTFKHSTATGSAATGGETTATAAVTGDAATVNATNVDVTGVNPTTDLNLFGYSDANYDSCAITRKSTYGYFVFLNGNPIHWASKRQSSISQSSTESEYVGINHLARELIWFQGVLYDLYGHHLTSTVFSDNQASIKWCTGENIAHQAAKHLDIAYKYVRQMVRDQQRIVLKWVSTKYMVADVTVKKNPNLMRAYA